MYKSTVWPGIYDFKLECGLWFTWLKDKINEIIFKIYKYESKLN